MMHKMSKCVISLFDTRKKKDIFTTETASSLPFARKSVGKNTRQVSSRACERDMQSREPQVVLAAHMSRPHVHLFCIIGHRFLSKRLLADCLQSFHHRALASRKQNEFMANGQL